MKELKDNEVDYTLVIVPFIAELIASDVSDNIRELRLNAIKQLLSRLACYKELGYMENCCVRLPEKERQ